MSFDEFDAEFSNVEVAVAVKADTAAASDAPVELQAIFSPKLSVLALDKNFTPPLVVAGGVTMATLRYIKEWYLLRDGVRRKTYRDSSLLQPPEGVEKNRPKTASVATQALNASEPSAVVPGRQGTTTAASHGQNNGTIPLLEILSAAYQLELKEIFFDHCVVFHDRIESLHLPWPIPMEQFDELGEKIFRKFYVGAGSRSRLSHDEMEALDLYFYGAAVAGSAELTHSVAPAKFAARAHAGAGVNSHTGKVNDVDWRQEVARLDPFQMPVWEPDSASSVCPSCGMTFTKLWWPQVLASHCRCCGKKKCTNCVSFRVDAKFAKLAQPGDGATCKACRECYLKTVKLSEYTFLSVVFAAANLNLLQISTMQLVNEAWRLASHLCLQEYRDVFYQPLRGSGGSSGFNADGGSSAESFSAGHGNSNADLGPNFSFSNTCGSGTAAGSPAGSPGQTVAGSNISGSGTSAGPAAAPTTTKARASSGIISPIARSILKASGPLLAGHPPAVLAYCSVVDWSDEAASETALHLVEETALICRSRAEALCCGGSASDRKPPPKPAPKAPTPLLPCSPAETSHHDGAGWERHPGKHHGNDRAKGKHHDPNHSQASPPPPPPPPPPREPPFSHWHLLCARTCTMPKLEFWGLQLLQCLNRPQASSVAAAKCRSVAFELILSGKKSKECTASGDGNQTSPCPSGSQNPILFAIVPLLLDLLAQNPRTELREFLMSLAAGDRDLLVLLYREICCRQLVGDIPSSATRRSTGAPEARAVGFSSSSSGRTAGSSNSGYLNILRLLKGDVERSFAGDELHRSSIFLEVLEELSGTDNTDRKVHRELFNRLTHAGLIPELEKDGKPKLRTTTAAGSSAVPGANPAALAPSQTLTLHEANSLAVLPNQIPLLPMPFPFDASITIVGLDLINVSVKNSAQRPLFVPLIASDGQILPILYKKEDLRKDYVVCNIIAVLEQLLNERGAKLSPIPKYRVLPTTPRSGLIEIVKNAKTVESLRDIRPATSTGAVSVAGAAASGPASTPGPTAEGRDSSGLAPGQSFAGPATITGSPSIAVAGGKGGGIKQVEAELAQRKPVEGYLHSLPQSEQLQRNFADSAAFYTFVTYLLGIADRHRDNVMVTDGGAILHIDFGFIIYERPTVEILTASYVRFDEDLKACVTGMFPGPMKTRLERFFEYSAEMLLLARPFTDIILNLLNHLVVHRSISEDQRGICEFIVERMMVGSRDSVAKSEFVQRVTRSMGTESMRDRLRDIKKKLLPSLLDVFYASTA